MNVLEKLASWIVDDVLLNWPHPRPAEEALNKLKIIAHRGVHESNLAIENTRPAFQLAVDEKLWAIECDVRWTKDLIPVIHHDHNCQRLFKKNIFISQSTWAELHLAVPQILRLSDVVEQFGKKIHLMLELKEDFCGPEINVKNAALKNTLAPLKPNDDYHLLSLEPQILERVTFAPKTSFMDVIWLNPSYVFELNARHQHGAVAGHPLFFNKNKVLELQSKGKQVGVGFIKSRHSLYREIAKGVDFVFTDNPLALKKSLLNPA